MRSTFPNRLEKSGWRVHRLEGGACVCFPSEIAVTWRVLAGRTSVAQPMHTHFGDCPIHQLPTKPKLVTNKDPVEAVASDPPMRSLFFRAVGRAS